MNIQELKEKQNATILLSNRLAKAEKHQYTADQLNELIKQAVDYNWTSDVIIRNMKTLAGVQQKFVDGELKEIE